MRVMDAVKPLLDASLRLWDAAKPLLDALTGYGTLASELQVRGERLEVRGERRGDAGASRRT